MSPPGRTRPPQAALVVVLAAAFVGAELSRASDPFRATALSMAGWGTFIVLFLWWLWGESGVVAGLRAMARVAVLTLVAFAVICAYHRHSDLLAAGIEVDAGYTFLGLRWFLEFDNPISYAGRTTSFAQFPLALFTHLPGQLLGFDRLGPFAIQLGILLQIGLLLALLTTWLVERPLPVQVVIAALAAAVFSNRLTLLLSNLTGYAIPAVAVGAIFFVIVLGDRTPAVVVRRVGGLLTLSVLHHYPGVFFVVPLVAAWVVAGRTPLRRVAWFARANVPLWAVVIIAVICVAIRPELLLSRLRAVTTPSLAMDEMHAKIVTNWAFIQGAFQPIFVQTFFRHTPGSWHLLDIAPLGGLLPQVVCANWLVTAVALGRRGVVYVFGLALLAAGLLVLTVLQHLVTGFEHYRDMMLVIGLVTSSIGFVFLIPRLGGAARVAVAGYALGVAAFGWHDAAALRGHRYGVGEYAAPSQATMETLRRYWRRDGGRVHGAAVGVVVREPFPLEPLYRDAALEHSIDLRFIDVKNLCRDPRKAIDAAFASVCGRVGVVLPAQTCPARVRGSLPWPPSRSPDGVGLYLFALPCESGGRDWSTPRMIDLAQ